MTRKKQPTRIMKVLRYGKPYYYLRDPQSTKLIRLPDHPAEAAAMAKFLLTGETLPRTPPQIVEAARALFTSSRSRASAKGIAHELSIERIVAMYEAQNGYCAVSGLPLDVVEPKGETWQEAFSRPYSPSIDRIDNSLGYTEANCRLVCRIANYAMGVWGEAELIRLSYAIVERQKSFAVSGQNGGLARNLAKPTRSKINKLG